MVKSFKQKFIGMKLTESDAVKRRHESHTKMLSASAPGFSSRKCAGAFPTY
jgi:hypothetical protein